jgi:hypothetical protein
MPPKKSFRRTKAKPQKRGRKPLGSKYINVSVPKELLGGLDAWIAKQPDAPVYPEAIRRLIAAGLDPAVAILPPDRLAELDTWMAAQKHRRPLTRLEAVRHLLGIVLRARQRPVPANDPKSPAKPPNSEDS